MSLSLTPSTRKVVTIMEQTKTMICRCEEVSLETLMKTMQEHACTSRELKLRTRAGMGYCGGRTCRNLIDKIVDQQLGKVRPKDTPLGYQPPVRPIHFFTVGNE